MFSIRRTGSILLAHASILSALCFVSPTLSAQSQAPTANPSPATMSVATGQAHAAILDEQHRPITAGGFVKKRSYRF